MPIATDPLSLLFIACFLFGLLFMVAAALLGSLGHGTHATHSVGHGVHAAHIHTGQATAVKGLHVGHGTTHATNQSAKGSVARTSGSTNNVSLFAYMNPTTIAVFLLGFGFFGYVFHDTAGFILPLTLVLAAIGGLIVAALLLAIISRTFGDSEGATIQDVSDRVGMLGKVSIAIPENGLGEVLYVSPGGMRKSIPARSIDGRRLERDQEVVVVNYQRGVAEIDTWDHFVNREDIPSDAVPDNDELAELRALLEEPEKKDTQFVMRKDAQKE